MDRYIGKKCASCGITFGNTDDVVVCPECGAPHHRACYNEEGKCAFESLHGEGFEWDSVGFKSEPAEENANGGSQTADSEETTKCLECGAENPPGLLYCKQCGTAIFLQKNKQNQGGNMGQDLPDGFFGGVMPPNPVSDDDTIDDVKISTLKRIIGNSWQYYIPVFLHMKRFAKKVTLNLSAMFFSGAWFIYRKMYTMGIILSMISIAIVGAEVLLYSKFSVLTQTLDIFEMMKIAPLPTILDTLLTLARFALMIFCALYGNKMYKNHCTKKAGYYASEGVSEQSEQIEKAGGVNLPLAIVAWSLVFAANYFFIAIIY